MYIEVYIDVVFAVNLILDFIILLLERKICKRTVSLNRIFLGAFTGAVLMCIIIMIPRMNYIFYLIFSYFFSSAIIIFVTFRPKKLIELIKLTLILYMIAILLGGIIFTLYYYSRTGVGINLKGLDLQMLLLFLSMAIIIWMIFINIFFKLMNVSKNIYQVCIYYQGKEIMLNGFLDTGNTLYDPISNYPVIVAEVDIFKELFSENNYLAVKNLITNIYNLNCIQDIQQELGINIRWIPFASLGNENGMLVGIVVEKVIVYIGKELKENKNVVVALYNNKLSKDNSYNVLLHPKLL